MTDETKGEAKPKNGPTPGWEKIVYSQERIEKYVKGEINGQQLHAVSGPEMLYMAVQGFRMFEEGKLEQAKLIFEGLSALDPKEAYYQTALGAVLIQMEDIERALFHLSEAIKLNPKEIAAFVNRGECFLREGKIQEAAEDFAQAVTLEKSLPPEDKQTRLLVQRARVLAAAALEMLEAAGNKAAIEAMKTK
jgi:tetratricopeptide (TPR) repeat protein